MATLEIEGRKVQVDDRFLSLTPEQQADTVDEIAAQIGISKKAAAPQAAPEPAPAPRQLDGGGIGQSVDSAMRGAADTMSFGMADEISGTLNAIGKSLNPFTDWTKEQFPTISGEIQKERDIQAYRDEANPVSSTVGRVAGGLAQGVGMARNGLSLVANAPKGTGVLGLAGRGAAEGAAYGGAYGLGSGEGFTGRVSEGLGGAAMGGVGGAVIPIAAAGVKAVAKPVVDAVSARVNPAGYASRKILERLDDAGLSADQAAAKVERGNRLSLADVGGKSVRGLLRTASNIPGKGADSISKTINLRQMGQGDRLRTIVGKTLGDPDGFMAAKDEIAATAKAIAEPLYRRAYSTPVHFSEELESILNTPAGKAALRKAEEIAGNEQVPFQQLFVQVADNGTATARRVPDARAWDYIKRGMDDVIDSQTDSLTGKVTTSGRAVVGLKNKLLTELDKANPAYAAARKAWGGQQSLDKALEFGKKAMDMSPEAVRRTVVGMSAAEKEAARAGLAEWVRNSIDKRGFTQNAILKFFSNRHQVANMRAVFDNDAQFTTFRKAVFDEARKRSTYEAVRGNSTTASQLADMAEAGGMREGLEAAKNVATGGVVSATLQWIGSRLKMLGGLTPDVADQIGKKLLTTDPATIRALTSDLMKLDASKVSGAQKSRALQAILTRSLLLPMQQMGAQPQ